MKCNHCGEKMVYIDRPIQLLGQYLALLCIDCRNKWHKLIHLQAEKLMHLQIVIDAAIQADDYPQDELQEMIDIGNELHETARIFCHGSEELKL